MSAQRKRARCEDCGFRKRGKAHAEGNHCKSGKGGKYQPPKRG